MSNILTNIVYMTEINAQQKLVQDIQNLLRPWRVSAPLAGLADTRVGSNNISFRYPIADDDLKEDTGRG